MYDPKSVYALNKLNPDAIIYRNADGTLTCLTAEDFDSPEEFQRWKELSDEDYHASENAELNYSKNISPLSGDPSAPSPEDAMVAACTERELEELRRLLREGMDTCLTKIQHRRLWMYVIDGMTEEAIAQVDGVKHQNVSRSILTAKKKLKKFFGK